MTSTFKSNKLQVFSTDNTKNFLVDSTDNAAVTFVAGQGVISIQGGTKLKVVSAANPAMSYDDVYAKLKALDDAITANSTQDLADQLVDSVARSAIVSAQNAIDLAQSAATQSVQDSADSINSSLSLAVSNEVTNRESADSGITMFPL